MSISIRSYHNSDYEMICSWWREHDECAPLPGMMIEDGTFVLEADDEPVMTLTAFKTQSHEVSYLEGFCAKPGIEKEKSHNYGQLLAQHCFEYLRSHGFKRVSCFSPHPSLTARYEKLGFTFYMNGLSALGRDL